MNYEKTLEFLQETFNKEVDGYEGHDLTAVFGKYLDERLKALVAFVVRNGGLFMRYADNCGVMDNSDTKYKASYRIVFKDKNNEWQKVACIEFWRNVFNEYDSFENGSLYDVPILRGGVRISTINPDPNGENDIYYSGLFEPSDAVDVNIQELQLLVREMTGKFETMIFNSMCVDGDENARKALEIQESYLKSTKEWGID